MATLALNRKIAMAAQTTNTAKRLEVPLAIQAHRRYKPAFQLPPSTWTFVQVRLQFGYQP